MKTIRELYKIGRGPSSSHTMAPALAARRMREAFPKAEAFRVILYGSLAKTGKGHLTDRALRESFAPLPAEILFDEETGNLPHPNTMDLFALKDGGELGRRRMLSVGGGSLRVEGEQEQSSQDLYRHRTFSSIAEHCRSQSLRLWEYVEQVEGGEIWDFLSEIWRVMQRSVEEGLQAEGVLPGGLGTERKAKLLYSQRQAEEAPEMRENRLVCAYAYAVSEQSASGGEIVTAPTCGACGVLPAVLRYQKERRGLSNREILRALATAGVIGNLIKTNASISGAECGCQAEIGSACCMASAALAELFGMDLDQIEYAAENAMEHMLGLTCDPIGGLVQIPCIERNAVAAMRAMNALQLAHFLTQTRKISFDMVVATMYETGKDLSSIYRETAEGGLAKKYAGKIV